VKINYEIRYYTASSGRRIRKKPLLVENKRVWIVKSIKFITGGKKYGEKAVI
jgi:hypothetical protein